MHTVKVQCFQTGKITYTKTHWEMKQAIADHNEQKEKVAGTSLVVSLRSGAR